MDIIERLNTMGLHPQKCASTNGGEWASACPACGGKDRFRVWPEKDGGRWWCRGCGKHGDDVQLLVDFCGMSYPDAFKTCDRQGKPADPPSGFQPRQARRQGWSPSDQDHPACVDAATWRDHAAKLVAWAHEKLLNDPARLAYLAGRGIDEATIRKFQIGYNPGADGKPAIFRPRESWGLPTEIKAGKAKRLWIPRGIVIPWGASRRAMGDGRWAMGKENKSLPADDRPCRIRIRRNTDDITPDYDVRYYVIPGSAMMPMLINPDRNAFVLVETELDAFMLDRIAGDLVGILALGSVTGRPDRRAHDALTKSLCILNALDYDAAGAGSLAWWSAHYPQYKRWAVEEGKDPGDAFAAGCDLREWLYVGLPPAWRIGRSSCLVKNQGVGADKEAGKLGGEKAGRPGGWEAGRQEKEDKGADLSAVRVGGNGCAISPTLNDRGAERVKPLVDSSARLRELLRRYPIKIIDTLERTGIEWPAGFDNFAVMAEVSDLVFGKVGNR